MTVSARRLSLKRRRVIRPSSSGLRFSFLRFSHARFSHARFSHARFSHARFSHARFSGGLAANRLPAHETGAKCPILEHTSGETRVADAASGDADVPRQPAFFASRQASQL